tara:strand:+ start:2457 stop:2963 length:507 start_codon:yes stop_codon:yes gene_type:complete
LSEARSNQDSLGEAIKLLSAHAYDEQTPVIDLLPRIAWKSFAFGLDNSLGDELPRLHLPERDTLEDMQDQLDSFHEAFLQPQFQNALAEAARSGNITKLGAAIQLHVAFYLDARSMTIEEVENHRLEHAIQLSTFCLCSSISLTARDPDLATVYWNEVCLARGDTRLD